MKSLKLISTILITLSILLTGYYTFSVATSGQEVIGTGIKLVLLFFLIITLFSYRLSLSNKNEKILFPTVITVMLISALLLMYFQRPWIDSLWNYTLAVFIILQGTNLLRFVKPNNKSGKIVHLFITVTFLYMIALCILKLGSPLLYTIAGIALILTSIGMIVNGFTGNKNQST